VDVGEEQGTLTHPVQQPLLAAPAKQLTAVAVQLGAVKACYWPLLMLAGSVMNLGCYVVFLQTWLAKYQSGPPAQNHIDVVNKRVAHKKGALHCSVRDHQQVVLRCGGVGKR